MPPFFFPVKMYPEQCMQYTIFFLFPVNNEHRNYENLRMDAVSVVFKTARKKSLIHFYEREAQRYPKEV